MSASLRDLQRRFGASLAAGGTDAGTRVYANTIRANYRNALAATFPVVRELTGAPFFNAAVDAFTIGHPSTAGDLNVYGDDFAGFLADYPYARDLPYLPHVARLEWAIDEASRAEDLAASARDVLDALARVPADTVTHQRFALDPSCRLVSSPFPVMRIWQVHQTDGDRSVDLDAGADHLLVRREGDVPVVARISPAEFAFLDALQEGEPLGAAVASAIAVEANFDLGRSLGGYVADGTVARLA